MFRRVTRLLLYMTLFVCFTCILCIAVNLHMIHSTKDLIFSADDHPVSNNDCILVLGCGIRLDGQPSQMLQDRLDTAISAYQAKLAPKILMSGDHGSPDYDEVNAMKDYAIAHGVPSEDIFMDHAGFSTYESMYRAKTIFGCQKMIIVTQRYHLYRALYNAQAMGMEAAGISSSLRTYTRQPYFDVREAAARVKDTLWCIFKPRPTYLGESISIFGNGDITNDRL